MQTVGISNFFRKTLKRNIFDGDIIELQKEVEMNLNKGIAFPGLSLYIDGKFVKAGYRGGVLLVSVDPNNFRCPVIKLQNGDRLDGVYDVRAGNEEPRKKIFVFRPGRFKLPPAVSVNIILYRKDVLLEDGDEVSGADWDMIAIQSLDTNEEAPMDPTTLMYNHFHMSGGTKTNMTPEEFEQALKTSVEYWKDRALVY